MKPGSAPLGRGVSGLGSMLSRLVRFVMAPAQDPRRKTTGPFAAHEELLDQLRYGRTQVAEAEHRLQASRTRLEAQMSALVERARDALAAGQDESARQLLRRRHAILAEVAAIASRGDLLHEEGERLDQLDLQVAARLESIRAEHEIDLTRQDVQQRVGDALAQISELVTQKAPRWLRQSPAWDSGTVDISALDRLGGLLEAVIDPYDAAVAAELTACSLEDELQSLRREQSAR